MANPARYGSAYVRARQEWAQVVAAGWAFCCEPRCVRESRRISPGEPWHLSHDPTGTQIIGPSHAACNLSEAARRGNSLRAGRVPRPGPWSPTRDW